MGQGFILFPILSILYIALFFEKRTQILSFTISVSSLLFVDNSLFISQEKSYVNPIQIYLVVIVLSSLFLNSLDL